MCDFLVSGTVVLWRLSWLEGEVGVIGVQSLLWLGCVGGHQAVNLKQAVAAVLQYFALRG